MLLVFGTSLRIPGFKMLVRAFAKTVRKHNGLCVLVNADEVASEWDDVFDYHCAPFSELFPSWYSSLLLHSPHSVRRLQQPDTQRLAPLERPGIAHRPHRREESHAPPADYYPKPPRASATRTDIVSQPQAPTGASLPRVDRGPARRARVRVGCHRRERVVPQVLGLTGTTGSGTRRSLAGRASFVAGSHAGAEG